MPADLHLHSIYSDGSFTPSELVEMAARKGIDTIALSDHDTIEGINEMIAAARLRDIEVIPAIEFSTSQDGVEIHILGYYIDFNSRTFLEEVKRLFDQRLKRSEMMVEKLNRLGVEISFQDVKEIAGDKYVGRPHIARAMKKAGYIKEIGEAFTDQYIGNGGRAYVGREKISPREAIEIIRKNGGIAVLAHPFFVNGGDSLDKKSIELLAEDGLEGLEVFHSRHSQEVSGYYLKIAEELGLLVTGGSDFHGESSPDVKIGDVLLADEYVRGFREYYKNRRKI
ncbi:MAG: PHP domain-containing protein [Halanaerobiaceae bacterium]|nr:PHP domain-containing protein [Halanaerobiaceae bacterium]